MDRRTITTILMLFTLLQLSCESEESKKALMEQAMVLKAVDDSVKDCCLNCCSRNQKPTQHLTATDLVYTIHSANASIDYGQENIGAVGITITLSNNTAFTIENLMASEVELLDSTNEVVGSFYPFFKVTTDCIGILDRVHIWESINLTAGCSLDMLLINSVNGCSNDNFNGIVLGQSYKLRYRFQNATYYSDYYLTDVTF